MWRQRRDTRRHKRCQRARGLGGLSDSRSWYLASTSTAAQPRSTAMTVQATSIVAPDGVCFAGAAGRLRRRRRWPGLDRRQLNCSVADQQDWLRSYIDDWYFWYALSPKPSPAGLHHGRRPTSMRCSTAAAARFPAAGGTLWPADRYSDFQSTESFNRFFGDGQTLGYGVAVAGLEVTEPTPQPSAAALRALHRAAVAGGGGRRRARRPRDVDQRRRRVDAHRRRRLQRPHAEAVGRHADAGAAQCGRRRPHRDADGDRLRPHAGAERADPADLRTAARSAT